MDNQQSFKQWISDLAPEIVAMFTQSTLEIGFSAAQSSGQGIIGLAKNNFLTKACSGYVSWRGKVIEHYSFNDENAERAAATLLTLRCLVAEGKGFAVNGHTTSSLSPWADAPAETAWIEAMTCYYTAFAEVNGMCKSLILNLPEGNAVAMSKSYGQIVLECTCKTSFSSQVDLFHRLQNSGMHSINDRLQTYAGFIGAMADACITPEDITRVLNADYSVMLERTAEAA